MSHPIQKRVLLPDAKRLIERYLSEGFQIELIPVRCVCKSVKSNSTKSAPTTPGGLPLKPGISPGIRITTLDQADAETGKAQEFSELPRRLSTVDVQYIENVLSSGQRVRLIPVDTKNGVKVCSVVIKTLHAPS